MSDSPIQDIQLPDGTNISADSSKEAPELMIGDDVDIDALRQFSARQTIENEKNKGIKNEKESNEEDSEESSEEVSEEETSSENDDELLDEEEKKDERPKENVAKKTITLKDGEKELSLSKDALIPITIDGKKQMLPLQEILNNASGNINVAKANSEIGRERKAVEQERETIRQEKAKLQANMDFLAEAVQAESPEAIVDVVALMKNMDPTKVWEKLVEDTLAYANKLSGLTEEQKSLISENKKFKLEKRLAAKEKEAQERAARNSQDLARVKEECEKRDISDADFKTVLTFVRDQVKKGELPEFRDAKVWNNVDKILDYTIELKRDAIISDTLQQVNPKLLQDIDFRKKVVSAITKAEAIEGVPFKTKEVEAIVKEAEGFYSKRLTDNLSQKVSKNKSSTLGTNSKIVKSDKLKKDNRSITLEEHYERMGR